MSEERRNQVRIVLHHVVAQNKAHSAGRGAHDAAEEQRAGVKACASLETQNCSKSQSDHDASPCVTALRVSHRGCLDAIMLFIAIDKYKLIDLTNEVR